jgi:hypothetical protein
MAALSLASLAGVLATVIGQASGVAISVAGDGADALQIADAAKADVCQQMQLSSCELPRSSFFMTKGVDGGTERLQVSMPDGRSQAVCLLKPPSSELEDFGALTWLDQEVAPIDHQTLATKRGLTGHEKRLYSLFAQAGSCARDEGTPEAVSAQRELAFASLATELTLNDPSFLGNGGAGAGEIIASGVGSEAGRVGASIARRIMVEGWKENLVELLREKGTCQVSVTTSRQPLSERPASSVGDEARLFACLTGTARQGSHYDVTDGSLAAFVGDTAPSYDLLDKFAREVGGVPSKADLGEIQSFIFGDGPFATFDHSQETAFSYAWQTANQIVGLR